MMFRMRLLAAMMTASLAASPMIGCENLPGEPGTQGAVIGGAGGAAAGAAVAGEENRLIGALIGGVLGAGGGYLIGANSEDLMGDEEQAQQEAQQAVEEARTDPATVEEVRMSDTADLNNDGFVTMDEVIALSEAGLPEQEILDRLRATGQVFELTPQQEDRLVDAGVSPYVVDRLSQLNQQERQRVLQAQRQQQREVISRPQNDRRGTQPPPRQPGNPTYRR